MASSAAEPLAGPSGLAPDGSPLSLEQQVDELLASFPAKIKANCPNAELATLLGEFQKKSDVSETDFVHCALDSLFNRCPEMDHCWRKVVTQILVGSHPFFRFQGSALPSAISSALLGSLEAEPLSHWESETARALFESLLDHRGVSQLGKDPELRHLETKEQQTAWLCSHIEPVIKAKLSGLDAHSLLQSLCDGRIASTLFDYSPVAAAVSRFLSPLSLTELAEEMPSVLTNLIDTAIKRGAVDMVRFFHSALGDLWPSVTSSLNPPKLALFSSKEVLEFFLQEKIYPPLAPDWILSPRLEKAAHIYVHVICEYIEAAFYDMRVDDYGAFSTLDWKGALLELTAKYGGRFSVARTFTFEEARAFILDPESGDDIADMYWEDEPDVLGACRGLLGLLNCGARLCSESDLLKLYRHVFGLSRYFEAHDDSFREPAPTGPRFQQLYVISTLIRTQGIPKQLGLPSLMPYLEDLWAPVFGQGVGYFRFQLLRQLGLGSSEEMRGWLNLVIGKPWFRHLNDYVGTEVQEGLPREVDALMEYFDALVFEPIESLTTLLYHAKEELPEGGPKTNWLDVPSDVQRTIIEMSGLNRPFRNLYAVPGVSEWQQEVWALRIRRARITNRQARELARQRKVWTDDEGFDIVEPSWLLWCPTELQDVFRREREEESGRHGLDLEEASGSWPGSFGMAWKV